MWPQYRGYSRTCVTTRRIERDAAESLLERRQLRVTVHRTGREVETGQAVDLAHDEFSQVTAGSAYLRQLSQIPYQSIQGRVLFTDLLSDASGQDVAQVIVSHFGVLWR